MTDEVKNAFYILTHGAYDLRDYCKAVVTVKNAYDEMERKLEELEDKNKKAAES